MFTTRPFATRVVCLAAVALALTAGHARAADATKEQKLIQVLQSDAPPQQKAWVPHAWSVPELLGVQVRLKSEAWNTVTLS